MPVVERDAAVVGSALDARAARVLLPRADAVRKRVVGRDVIHRPGVLVVPVAPAASAICGDHRALVGDGKNDLRVVGIDPDALVVVAAGRAADGAPRQAAVHRAPHDRRRGVDDLRIFGIDGDRRQIAAADADEGPHVLRQSCGRAGTANRLEPVRAGVDRLVEADRSLEPARSWRRGCSNRSRRSRCSPGEWPAIPRPAAPSSSRRPWT